MIKILNPLLILSLLTFFSCTGLSKIVSETELYYLSGSSQQSFLLTAVVEEIPFISNTGEVF